MVHFLCHLVTDMDFVIEFEVKCFVSIRCLSSLEVKDKSFPPSVFLCLTGVAN